MLRAVHYSKSSARFSAGAEWVSAPTEMRSTPVSAIARTVSSVTPPDASVSARPEAMATARGALNAIEVQVEEDSKRVLTQKIAEELKRLAVRLGRDHG